MNIKTLNAYSNFLLDFENAISAGGVCYCDLELNSQPFVLCNISLHTEINSDLNVISDRHSTEVRLFLKKLDEFNRKRHLCVIAGSFLELPFSPTYMEIMNTLQGHFVDINDNKQYYTYYYNDNKLIKSAATTDYIFIPYNFKLNMFYVPPSDNYCEVLKSQHVPLMCDINIDTEDKNKNKNNRTSKNKSSSSSSSSSSLSSSTVTTISSTSTTASSPPLPVLYGSSSSSSATPSPPPPYYIQPQPQPYSQPQQPYAQQPQQQRQLLYPPPPPQQQQSQPQQNPHYCYYPPRQVPQQQQPQHHHQQQQQLVYLPPPPPPNYNQNPK